MVAEAHEVAPCAALEIAGAVPAKRSTAAAVFAAFLPLPLRHGPNHARLWTIGRGERLSAEEAPRTL